MQLKVLRVLSTMTVGLITLPTSIVAQTGGTDRRVNCDKYGFSIAVPAGFDIGACTKQTIPLFIRVDRSKLSGNQDRLPMGGATIGVVSENEVKGDKSAPKWLATTRDWASAMAALGTGTDNKGPVSVVFPDGSGVTEAVSTEFQILSPSGDQEQECFWVSWRFGGRLFSAHLEFVKGDPGGGRLREVYMEALRSIRPLRK
jgi:hypothetical protein